MTIWIPIYREAVKDATEIDKKLVVATAEPSVVVSSDGTVLYRIASVRRVYVDTTTLPKYVRDAIVSAEDRRFYTHKGIDFVGLLRASLGAVERHHGSGGGSTIEMQIAKNLVNGDERTMQRKLKDIATAHEIEELKNKTQILDLYMNQVYYGEGAFGIEAAAETYFGKHAAKLDIAEAAMLARCIRTPTRQNPVRDLQGSIDRRNYVLDVMRDEAFITDDEYEKAYHETPKLDRYSHQGVRWINTTAGYFVEHVLQVFHEDHPLIDLQEGGYRIETTLNLKFQKAANEAVAETLREHRDQRVSDAAIVVIDSDGKILAEVGGRNYNKRKFNIISQGRRQAGSSFKPFVYAAALKEGAIQIGDEISNEPIYEDRYGTSWTPKNNGRERIGGFVSVRSAFINSMNLPAIHTIQKVTPETVVSYARDTFGFQKSPLRPFESLGIGTSDVYPLEMARGYSVFMLRGDRVNPYPIDRIVQPDGVELEKYKPVRVSTGFDSNVCEEIDSLMRDVVTSGTGTAADVVPDARGKTGTTQDAKDAWFCGYSDGILAIGWAGNPSYDKHGKASYRPMASSVYGGTVTAGMWAKVLLTAHAMNLCHAPKLAAERVASVAPRHPKKDPDEVPIPGQEKPDPNKAPDPNDDRANDDSSPTVPDNAPPAQTVTKPPKQTPAPKADKQDDSPPPSDDDTPKPRRVSTPQRNSDDEDSGYVTVEICADTGMRASRYCPETVPRRFRKGTEPRQVCRLHTGN